VATLGTRGARKSLDDGGAWAASAGALRAVGPAPCALDSSFIPAPRTATTAGITPRRRATLLLMPPNLHAWSRPLSAPRWRKRHTTHAPGTTRPAARNRSALTRCG